MSFLKHFEAFVVFFILLGLIVMVLSALTSLVF